MTGQTQAAPPAPRAGAKPAGGRASAGELLRGRLLPWISTPLLLVGVVATWKLIIAIFDVSPFVLPQPEDVFAGMGEVIRSNGFTTHLRVTLTETLLGFGIALVTGVAMGAILGRTLWLERAVRPLVVAAQVVPKVALVPLFIVWFGFGITSKVVIVAILAFFPIMLNTLLGTRSVEPGHRDVMRGLNAGRWATFWRLDYHSTMPYVFAGMEIGIVFAIIGAVVGEYLGGNQGLGYLIVLYLNALNARQLFAVIVILTLIGFALFLAVIGLKRLFIPWHESVSASDTTTT
ncbi:MAG TPA: ABC transporter permease [Streptosporangiaceae bacterium]|jgi:NitT/TauT family transport system permease protein|nr:ABC transporter permease [Streptosporangiaceae bacterium]